VLEDASNLNLSLPTANLLHELFASLIENGHGESDHTALFLEILRINDIAN
jgi:2-hydroxy-3-oxopropionate reductase